LGIGCAVKAIKVTPDALECGTGGRTKRVAPGRRPGDTLPQLLVAPLHVPPPARRKRTYGPATVRYSLSVGMNGSPRLPLKSLFNRRSFELFSRRRTPGATSFLVSRRARRPRNQSSQLIARSMGIEGTLDFEFMGNFAHQRFTRLNIAIFGALRNPPDLVPVHLDLPPQGHGGEGPGAFSSC